MKLLSIIVSFALAFGFMTAIQQSDSYAEESNPPTTTLNVVGAKEEVTWRIAKTMPLKENYTSADTQTEFKDYVLGTPIERTWENTGEDGVVPYWSIKSSELKKCGIITGISLSKDDNTFIRSYYASDLTVSYEDITSLKRSELESPAKAGAMTVDGVTPVNSEYDSYRFSCLVFHDTQNKMMMNKSVITMRDDNTYAEVYWNDNTTELKEAKDPLNTIFTIYFNGEERELRFDVEDEDMTVEIGEKCTRTANTQSSYYSEDAVISYVSSDESIATVDATSGEVTGVAEGEANITASIKDGDKETSKSYKVVVTKAVDPAVVSLVEMIDDLPDPDKLTLEDESAVDAAQAAYEKLNDEQKTQITNYNTLLAAREKIVELKQAAADKAAKDAKDAQDKADAAQAAADKAAQDAKDAQDKADAAQAKADTDQAKADADQAVADKAAQDAKDAQAKADEAQAKADADQAKADEAAAAADKAAKDAKEAQDKAEAAQAAAEQAAKDAKEAQDKADSVQKGSDELLKAAQEALKAAESELNELHEKISAAELTVKKVKAKSKGRKFTVKWEKNKDAEGYKVEYRKVGSNKYKLLKEVSKNKVTSKKLKKKVKYQFRVTTYKTVDGQKIYGVSTETKAVKCK